MGDTERLERVLWIAVLGSCAAFGCMKKKEEYPPPEPSCDYARWSGTLEQARAFARAADEKAASADSCPASVVLPPAAALDDGSWVPTEIELQLEPCGEVPADPSGPAPTCCYETELGCMGGRPLLDGHRAVVATPRAGRAWDDAAMPTLLPEDPGLRDALGRAWLADALVEHASIASFARATLELLAVGAPPELVADTQRAALDEIRHAQSCFAIARAYGVDAADPGPLASPPSRSLDLPGVARATFVEGCLGETAAALAATRAAADCRDPAIRRVLAAIADDETRHAALAWRIVTWAACTGGPAVAAELRRVARAVETGRITPAVAGPAVDEPTYGRLGPAAAARTAHDAWQRIACPLLTRALAARTC